MSYHEEYEEPKDHVFFGLPYRSTDSVSRRIQVELKRTKEFLEWHALDSQIKHHHIYSDDKDIIKFQVELSEQVAKKLAAAEARLMEVLYKLIERILSEKTNE